VIRDPRIDPQPGDEVRAPGGRLRKVVARDGYLGRCLAGVIRRNLTLRDWQKWCQENDVMVTKIADQRP